MQISIFSFVSNVSFIHSFVLSSFHQFIHSIFHSFVHLFVHSFIHSFIISFVRSFIHSFGTLSTVLPANGFLSSGITTLFLESWFSMLQFIQAEYNYQWIFYQELNKEWNLERIARWFTIASLGQEKRVFLVLCWQIVLSYWLQQRFRK